MFRKILIANRGEIAVRVIRACRDLNISPVAVFSEADAGALHVRLADEAVCIGPAPSIDSYLNINAVIDAARQVNAEAIHRGDGFLAENADFVRAAIAAGVSVVPGTTEALVTVSEARETAARFGYPVMLKAAAGGGGKGMRL